MKKVTVLIPESKVRPEIVKPGQEKWERYRLHDAADIYHVQQKYHATPDMPVKYKVAWKGGCVLYDTKKLKNAGGFGFWEDLPPDHRGEDVLAQLRVMKKYRGCGILPSGVYHQELSTTLPGNMINAPECLPI